LTIGVIGCGLIGGSIGLAARSGGHLVWGAETDGDAAKIALNRGCVDQIVALEAASGADLVFVCVPPNAIVRTLEEVYQHAPPSTVVTDCGSVKADVVRWLSQTKHSTFVPGHPMAGHEKSGPQFASGWMFRGAKWILTPAKCTSRSAIKVVESAVKELGATPIRVDAERHDREVALLSHLPHAIAAALVRIAANLESAEASAGSWKDLTRVAGVDPNLWSQILFSNREEVGKVLDELSAEMEALRQALDQESADDLLDYFIGAKRAKEQLG
jgi:prephenate dehydrogenase